MIYYASYFSCDDWPGRLHENKLYFLFSVMNPTHKNTARIFTSTDTVQPWLLSLPLTSCTSQRFL